MRMRIKAKKLGMSKREYKKRLRFNVTVKEICDGITDLFLEKFEDVSEEKNLINTVKFIW